MERHENLTNESLNKKFGSQFELVNFAIHVAKDMIASERAPRVETDAQNPAHWVLEEIEEDKAYFDDIEEVEPSLNEVIKVEEIFVEPTQNIAVG